MIAGNIENKIRYTTFGENVTKALKYLSENDFSTIQPGKYEIDGDRLFALVQEYETKPETEVKLEGHRKYADIQYVVTGTEKIGYADISAAESMQPYSLERDVEFFSAECSWLKMLPGMFCILFPEDLHRPGVMVDGAAAVRKVVMKILL